MKVGKEWVELDGELLPSPFTPKGERPKGPAWYATPTVAYAVELGYDVRADRGVGAVRERPLPGRLVQPAARRLPRHDGRPRRRRRPVAGRTSWRRWTATRSATRSWRSSSPRSRRRSRAAWASCASGPRGEGWKPGEPWRALSRPDLAAGHPRGGHLPHPDQPAPQDRQARGVHRAVPGRDPVRLRRLRGRRASPLDFLPYREGKPLPGGFKLGINPGLVKHEGTQTVLWGEEVREQFNAPELNLARYIKDGTVTDADNGE